MPPDERLVHDVVRLAKEGMTRRAIGRALRISRTTVRSILDAHDEGREQPHSAMPSRRRINRPSKLDRFRPRVEGLFKLYPDITAQRVFEILRDEGYDGGQSIVKDLVRKVRPKKAPKASLETAPREPGEIAECDWSPYSVTFTHASPMQLQVFGYMLRYSTRKFFSFHEGNGLHPLMDGHVHAFERFGGAAHRCKYDCQKPVVLRWEGGRPIYNPRFIDFATYYEFQPVACRPRHPNDKPRVERAFFELTLSFFRGRSFRDLDDLKGQLVHWMDTVADQRPLKRMRRRTRMELFLEEQPLMRSLPRHHYDTARVLYKLCDIEGFISWDGNWYSLPYEYVTEILPVRITENELFIYKSDLTCIARHQLYPRGAQKESILPGHRPRRASHGPDLDQLRSAFADLGEQAAAFIEALERREPRSAGYHARKVLALREGYSTDSLLEALSHALAYGALEHSSVERILLARAKPRKLDEYVAEETARKLRGAMTESNTEPRDLAEYDSIPCHRIRTEGDRSCPDKEEPRVSEACKTESSSILPGSD